MNSTTLSAQHIRRLNFYKTLILCIIVSIPNLIAFNSVSQAKVLFQIGPQNYWRYSEGAHQPKLKWQHSDFDDSKWKAARPGDNFGDQIAVEKKNIKIEDVYLRYKFLIENPVKIKRLVLTIVTNATFTIYLNGIEVIRSDTGLITIDKVNSKKLKPELIDLNGFIDELLPGPNVIAIKYKGTAASFVEPVFYPTLEAFDAE